MRATILATIAFGFLVGPSASAQGHRTWTREEAIEADKSLDSLSDWRHVYESFKRHGHCDDGAIAEGYSEAVARLLAGHWDDLPLLLRYTRQDPNFERFILHHIDETISLSDAKIIHERAETKCPAHARQLCKLIVKASARSPAR